MEQATRQAFQFSVPKLPNTTLAVGMREVLAVTDLPTLTLMPLTPSFVLGLSEWQDRLVTVLNLAAALMPPATTLENGSHDALYQARTQHYLVAQVMVEAQRELVAWPVLPGASARAVPPQAKRAGMPPYLAPALIYTVVALEGGPLILLDLGRLSSYDAHARTLDHLPAQQVTGTS